MPFISVRLTDDYATSMFSAGTRALRHANNDRSGRNYATFLYVLGPGAMVQVHTARSGLFHSEKEVWLGIRNNVPLNRILVPNWLFGQLPGANMTANALAAQGVGIFGVYTERQPCGTCTPFLNDILPDGTPVFWHFMYASDETSKFDHDPDTTAVFSMLAMAGGKSYDDSAKDTRRQSRQEGNSAHKMDMSGMGSNWSKMPLTSFAQARAKFG
jgi:hypothetical protein